MHTVILYYLKTMEHQRTLNSISHYKSIEPKGSYEVWISALPLSSTGEYRVNVLEECDAHITQSVDVNLQWPRHRRWLENYVRQLSEQTNLKSVVFGNGGSINDCHYPLWRYKELFGSWKEMDFLKDLNIAF